MRSFLNFLCRCFRSLNVRTYLKIYMPYILSQLNSCGKNVVIGQNNRMSGLSHMHFGSNIHIGPGCLLYSTIAHLYIGNYVNFGPNVTIITGDHRIDLIGEYMKEIGDDNKLPANDADVIIEDDVWVGTGAIILKGVTIGKGSVIAAGAVVTKNVAPYTIYISKDKQKPRFTPEQIVEHEKLIFEKYGSI